MDSRRALGIAVLILAVGVLAVTLFPGILVGDPGPYNETTVTVVDENGSELATVEVRIADTDAKRFTGLSETDSLGRNEGMLFVHEKEDEHSYVMRDMSFPIDILFVDENGTIVRIVHANVDGENTPYSAEAKYALEVNRGWANRIGVSEGDVVEIPDEVS